MSGSPRRLGENRTDVNNAKMRSKSPRISLIG